MAPEEMGLLRKGHRPPMPTQSRGHGTQRRPRKSGVRGCNGSRCQTLGPPIHWDYQRIPRQGGPNVKTVLSRGSALVESVCLWIPGAFFAQWALRRGLLWTPQRLFWMALFMAWSAEQTLAERFDAARDLLQILFPRWCLGASYSGWLQALAHWDKPMRAALAKRLRKQIQGFGARHQTRCWLAGLRCRRLASGVPAHGHQQGRVGLRRQEADGSAVVSDVAVAHGHGLVVGLPHRARHGQRTASPGRHGAGPAAEVPGRGRRRLCRLPLCRRLQDAHQSFLIRVGSNRQLLRKLGYAEHEGPSTVYLWPEDHQQELPLTLRLIELRKGKKSMYLLTNVLDEDALSLADAAALL